MVTDFLRKGLSGLLGALTRLWARPGAPVLATGPNRSWRAATELEVGGFGGGRLCSALNVAFGQEHSLELMSFARPYNPTADRRGPVATAFSGLAGFGWLAGIPRYYSQMAAAAHPPWAWSHG